MNRRKRVRADRWLGLLGVLSLVGGLGYGLRGGARKDHFAMPGEIRRISERLGWKEPDASPKRRLSAGETGGRCLRDRLSTEAIRAEVTRLESGARRAVARVGTWSAEVPAPQAAMLAVQNGRWYAAAQSVSLTGCTDVICVVNRIGGRPDGDGLGLKIYAWYLKMGYALASTPEVSEILKAETESRPASEFFFTDEELTALWKLSQMLPVTFRAMPHLTVLHRIPRGEISTDWMDESCVGFPGEGRLMARTAANGIQQTCHPLTPGSSGANESEVWTCGDAGFQGRLVGNPGFIRLSDRCLTLDRSVASNRGSFWTSVTHEMSHRLDYSLAGPNTSASRGERRSTSDSWKAFSGWTTEETRDGSGRVISRQWKSDSTKEGFVREYAGTSPAEDWAESVAWARFQADDLLRVAPQKAAYIRDQVYGGRSFTQAGLLTEYRTRAVNRVRASLLEIVQDCFATPGAGASEATLASPVPLSGSWLQVVSREVSQCIAVSLSRRFGEAFDELRLTEWEACDALTATQEAAFRSDGMGELAGDLERIVSEQAQVAEILRASRELRERLLGQTDKREAFLRCQLEADPRTCFTQAMTARFDSVVIDLAARLGATLETERQVFLHDQSYEAAHAGVLAFYRQLFAGFEAVEATSVKKLTDQCASGAVEGPLVTTPFSGGTGYVAPGLLTCLNQGIAKVYDETRHGVLDPYGLALTGEGALRFTEAVLFEPGVLDGLQRWVTAQSVAEDQAFQAGVASKAASLAAPVSGGDLAWLTGLQTRDAIRAGCQERVSPAALTDAQAASPRFQAPEQWARTWTEAACVLFLQSAAVQSRIESILAAERAAAAQAWSAAIRDLEGRAQAALQSQGATCRQRYPQRNSSARSQRARCVRDQWPSAKSAAVREWLVSNVGSPYAARRVEAERALEDAKTRLVEAAAAALERQ